MPWPSLRSTARSSSPGPRGAARIPIRGSSVTTPRETSTPGSVRMGRSCGPSGHRTTASGTWLVQADGKIVVTGYANDASGRRAIFVARFTASGSFDPSFGTNGTVLTYIGAAGNVSTWDLAIQGDGRIVVAGVYSNGSNTDVALARYNTDGSLDDGWQSDGRCFGTAGKVLIDRAPTRARVPSPCRPTGRSSLLDIPIVHYSDTLTARLNSDGSPDDGSSADSTPGDSFGIIGGVESSFGRYPTPRLVL